MLSPALGASYSVFYLVLDLKLFYLNYSQNGSSEGQDELHSQADDGLAFGTVVSSVFCLLPE